MADPTTSNKALFVPANGSNIDVWDVPVNANWNAIDVALGGVTTLNANGLSGTQALTATQYQPLAIIITGAPTADISYQVPASVGGIWRFQNNTTGGFNVGINSASGGGTVIVAAGQHTLVTCDGSAGGMVSAITTTGAAAGSPTQLQFNSAGTLGASAGLTWDGTTVAATGLNIAGNAALGATAGNTLTVNGTAVAIPNSLNINSGSFFINQGTGQVGIGITTGLTSLLTVAGSIKSTTGGYTFPDNTVQTTAAQPTLPAGSNGQVQFNNSGVFGASSALTFNNGTGALGATSFVGAWAGSAIPIANGGTGVAALAQNLATNGYQTLVGGAILIWGVSGSIGSGLSSTINLPVTLTTFSIPFITARNSSGALGDNQSFASSGLTSITITNAANGSVAFSWWVIGK